MTERIYNFSAGPAVLPVPVLERAREEMLSLAGVGMSVMEISHRSKTFDRIIESAKNGVRELLGLPANYQILFLQGGASMQFAMIPMNFLPAARSADYVVTGQWGVKAVKEAKLFGEANVVFSTEGNGFRSIPSPEELNFDPRAAYVHYTSNETIDGVEFNYDLDAGNLPVVCDASSNIMSRPIEVEKYDLIYAGAQKNLGPSGVTLVIVRDDLLERANENLPRMLDYRYHARNDSLANTPNTWGIYILDLVCQWLKEQGGLAAMQKKNQSKAKILYDALDTSDGFYLGHAERAARSAMNVTFRLPSEELEAQFVGEAAREGLDGLKGHRTVGGIRASIYNAFPLAGVKKLIEFMRDFQQRNG